MLISKNFALCSEHKKRWCLSRICFYFLLIWSYAEVNLLHGFQRRSQGSFPLCHLPLTYIYTHRYLCNPFLLGFKMFTSECTVFVCS